MYVLKQWDDYEIKVYNLNDEAIPANLDKFLRELGVHCFDGESKKSAGLGFFLGDYVFVLFKNNSPIGAVTRYRRSFEAQKNKRLSMCLNTAGGLYTNYRGLGLYRHIYDVACHHLKPHVSMTWTQNPAIYKTITKSAKDMKLLLFPQKDIQIPDIVHDILKNMFEAWSRSKNIPTYDTNLVFREMYEKSPYKISPYIGDAYFDNYLKLNPLDAVAVVTIHDTTLEYFKN